MGAPPVTPVLRTPANDDAKKQELYVLLIIDVPAHSRVSVRAPLPAPPATSSAVCSPRLSQGCSPATEVRRGRRRRRDVRAPPSFQANMHTAQKGGGAPSSRKLRSAPPSVRACRESAPARGGLKSGLRYTFAQATPVRWTPRVGSRHIWVAGAHCTCARACVSISP